MSEPTYTLQEAAAELARRECERGGHRFDIAVSTTLEDASGEPIALRCSRCARSWKVTA